MSSNAPVRILVTGASGFVGVHLVRKLITDLPTHSEIVLADRHPSGSPTHERCRSVRLDVTDADAVNRVISAERPTHVMHLAAIAAVTAANRDVRLAWSVNFGGTQNIALAISELASDCRLIYCSSAEVYGASFKSNHALDETALLQPVNPYGAAKAAADIMLGQMALGGLRVVRLRPFNHTGPGQSTQFAIPAFASQIAKIEHGTQEPIIRVGDLRSRRDFLDVHDVVDAYCRAILRFDDLPNGGIMNIASGEARALESILHQLLALSSATIEVVVDEDLLRPNDTPVVLGDSRRAADWLDWSPKYAWNETLESILTHWRAVTANLVLR